MALSQLSYVDKINPQAVGELRMPPPVANFTGCGTYNMGDTVTLTNTSTGSPTSFFWLVNPADFWSYVDGTAETTENIRIVFNDPITFSVDLMAMNSFGTDIKSMPSCVVIRNRPDASFTGCGDFSVGDTVTLSNTSPDSPVDCNWSITPATGWSYVGGTTNTSQSPKVKFTTSGTYNASLVVAAPGGKDTAISLRCMVINAGSTGNAGLENDETDAGITLHPNPSTGTTILSFGNQLWQKPLQVSVYNAVGQRLQHISGDIPSEVPLNLSGYRQGIYFVEVKFTQKVVRKQVILRQ